MKKMTLMVCVAFLAGGCAGNGVFDPGVFTSEVCNPPVSVLGITPVGIKYGDSHLFVIPVAKIKPNSEIHFRLLPQHKPATDQEDFDNATVTISSADDNGDSPANWLDASGSYSADDGVLKVCVPDTLTKTSYKYEVTVQYVGNLDPRADVF